MAAGGPVLLGASLDKEGYALRGLMRVYLSPIDSCATFLPERTRGAQLNLLPVVALAMSALQPEWWRPRLQEDFVAILR